MKRIVQFVPYILLTVLMSGCFAAAKAPAAMPITGMDESAPAYSEAAPASPGVPMQESAAGGNVANSGDYSSSSAAAPTERIVINNASLSIVVDDPATAMEAIQKSAVEKGGFVVSSNLYKTTIENGAEVSQASITVRVPFDQLNDSIAIIKSMVKNPAEDIRNEKVTGEDVTQEYTDIKSRLKNLENTRDQLREIMQSAQRTEDVLAVLTQLNQITEQIEVLQGQINFYDTSARYSAISVDILSTEAVKPLSVGGWQPVGVARDAIQALINMVKFLVNVLIWMVLFIAPLLILIIIPIRIAWVLFRRWQKRRKQAKVEATLENPPPAAPPAPKAG